MKKSISLLVVMSIIATMLTSFGAFGANNVLAAYTFEKDNEGWVPWSSSSTHLISITDEASSEGSKSLLVNDDTDQLNTGVKSKKVDVKPGETYTALCDMYLASGSAVTFYLRFYDASGKTVSDNNAKGTKGKWVNLAITAKAPEGAVNAEAIVATVKVSKSAAYVDNLKVVTGEVKATEITGKAPASAPAPSQPTTTTPSEPVKPLDDGVKDGEMIYSYGFESGLNPWGYQTSNSSTFVTEIANEASEGKMAIGLNDNSQEDGPGVKSENIKVSEGNTYTITADVIGKSGTIKLFAKYFNAAGKEIGNNSQSIPVASTWTPMAYSTIAPAGATSMQVLLCGIKSSLGEAWIDNVKVYKGNVKAEIPEKEYIEPKQVPAVNASIVAPVNNKLQYNTYNAEGDTLGDFSYAGFAAGEYNLPDSKDIPVAMTVSPTGTEDDTDMIQAAINKVYDEAANNNFKILKLKAGKYYINRNGIKLKSGVLLSGEGQGPTGTILYAYDKVKNTTVSIAGKKPVQVGEKYNIQDSYVKSGSKVINLTKEDAGNFKKGDLIMIYHPSTEKWVEGMRMINMESSAKGDNSWIPGAVDFYTERTIAEINGGEITLDFPVFVPYNKEYSQSYIYKLNDEERIVNSGVENLRIESYYNGSPTDENHGNQAVSFSYAKNCFVRDISAKHFVLSAVACGTGSKQITVLNCSSLEPISIVQGGRRYAFASSTYAQQLLFSGCYSYDGRHDFEASFTVTGPIVFNDSIIDKSNSSAETHGTWSTGVLYDNIYQVPNDTPGYLCIANRGIYGSSKSQGWTAGGCVMWNTLSNLVISHKPPMTYQNFSVGTWGTYDDQTAKGLKASKSAVYRKYFRTTDHYNATDEHYATKDGTSFIGDAYKEAEFTPVEPRSLYKAQLSERFTGTILNARPNAPVIVYPRYDKEYKDSKVTVSGVYQLGAEKVTVYIDDIAYNAKLDSSDNSFEFAIDLAEGTHKIYATQHINGNESTKTADRFVIVGKLGSNESYLQSVYDISKTTSLINDPRLSYTEYEKKMEEELKNKITVIVNDSILQSDVAPFETNGRVLVPMRAIFEALNADVSWDEGTATATAVLNETTVKITENQTTAYVNESPVVLDVPATIVNGRFVVPVRFISESFGAKVDWIDIKKTVVVDGGIKYPANHGIEGELNIFDAIQSGDDGAGSVISNIFDNDMDSKWGVAYTDAKPDGAFGIFDLGSSINIKSVHIALHSGNARIYNLDFYSSDDGVNFTPLKVGHKTTGTTADFEEIPLNVKARYIKIVGKGNSVNHWLNVREIAFTK